MNIIKKIVTLFAALLIYTPLCQGMQNPVKTIYAIPGQNGGGSSPEYVQTIMGNDYNLIPVTTPTRLPDLGQYFCQRHLDRVLADPSSPGLIYASSQGGATALNYAATGKHRDKITGMILEAPLISGNSGIHRTVTGPYPAMQMEWAYKIPGSYYIIPYIASLLLWGYRPGGAQAIRSIDQLPTDLPIVIVQSKDDFQVPAYGAQAAYYRLRTNGNNNVYFIKKQDHDHLNLLFKFSEERHNQLIQNIQSVFLSHPDNGFKKQYQPEHEQYKSDYDRLIAQEQNHVHFEQFLITSGLCLVLLGAYTLKKRMQRKYG